MAAEPRLILACAINSCEMIRDKPLLNIPLTFAISVTILLFHGVRSL